MVSNQRKSPIQNQKGFSLLEIIIALTIMGFLSISLFTITSDNIDTKEMVVSEDREFLQVYTAMYRLDKDFSEIYSPLYYSSLEIATKGKTNANDPYGSNASYDQQASTARYKFRVTENFPLATVKNIPVPAVTQEEKTSLRFMTASNKRFFEDQKQSRHAWVEYFLAPDDREDLATADFQLMRREVKTNIYDPDIDFQKVPAHVMLRGIKEFKIEFYSRDQEKWVDNIRYITTNEKYTPRSLRITLVWVDSNKSENTQIRIFRPYWPYFDVVKDETERQTQTNPNSSNQNNNQRRN